MRRYRLPLTLIVSVWLFACSEDPAPAPCGGECAASECIDGMCVRTRTIVDMMVPLDATADMLAIIDMAPPPSEAGLDMAEEPDAAPPEPDAAPGRHPVLDGPVPPFDTLAADEIEALCADQVAQIADLTWVAQQIGTDAFTLEEAHCAYLVGRTAANANHPVDDCEERLPACVETVREIFEGGDFLQADCTGALAAGRAAGCQSSASLYLDCLRDGYPQRVSFGFTANQLARLSLMDCEEIVASVQNFLPRMNPPLSCTLLRRRCAAAAPPP
jgi:hypothetical protein